LCFKIGMMRCGRLLVEDSPENLIRDYGLPSLEDVFLKVCLKDIGKSSAGQFTEAERNSNETASVRTQTELQPSQSSTAASNNNEERTLRNKSDQIKSVFKKRQMFDLRSSLPSPHVIRVLLRKNALVMIRNFGYTIFTFS
jgi:ABC-type multidrug transport system ATPase subunit